MRIVYLLFPATPVRNPAYSRNNTHLRMAHVAHGACMQMAEEVNQIQDSHDQVAPSDGNARQEIIDNLDFYHTIVEYIQDGMYFVDTDRKILFWNTGAENLTVYDKIATTGFYCFDNLLRHVDDSGEELCHDGCPLQATMQDGVPRQARVYLHHRQGHRVPVQVKTAATRLHLYRHSVSLAVVQIDSSLTGHTILHGGLKWATIVAEFFAGIVNVPQEVIKAIEASGRDLIVSSEVFGSGIPEKNLPVSVYEVHSVLDVFNDSMVEIEIVDNLLPCVAVRWSSLIMRVLDLVLPLSHLHARAMGNVCHSQVSIVARIGWVPDWGGWEQKIDNSHVLEGIRVDHQE